MVEVKLRDLTLADTANIIRWRNQPEVYRNLFSQHQISEEQHTAYYHKFVETGLVRQYVIETIIDESKLDIGTVFLKNIDEMSRKAEFGIFIGEPKARGRGLSSSIVKATLEIAFKEIHLNKVYLTVFSNNVAAIRSYEKAGFKVDGILRQDFFDGERFIDVVIMSILSTEYTN